MAFPGIYWMMVFVLAFAICNKNTASSGRGGIMRLQAALIQSFRHWKSRILRPGNR